MRYIAQPRLDAFIGSRINRQESEIARRDLAVWSKLVRAANWSNFAGLKQTFGSADQVGNCVVFDVGNNRYRLIGRINYSKGIVYILKVMDHGEYDKRKWPDECGCFQPPPKNPPPKAAAKSKPTRRKRR